METAVFQRFGGVINGLLRVYRTKKTASPTPYKFFVGIEVFADRHAEIHGMKESDITIRDVRALDREIATLGARTVEWIHNKKHHRFKIKNNLPTNPLYAGFFMPET